VTAGKLRSRFGAGVLIVAALSVGGLIRSGTPDVDTSERPFARAGAVGRKVDAQTYDATVLAVRGATKIHRVAGLTKRGDRDTDGVWVLVKVRLLAHREAVQVGWAGLKDGRDRVFSCTDRIDQPLVCAGRMLQPGIPVTGEVAFEVPRDAGTDLTIQLNERPIDHRMTTMIEVQLPISRGMLDGWIGNAASVEVPPAVVG
jgi:hypothetical protein